jgi:hypothetical protein
MGAPYVGGATTRKCSDLCKGPNFSGSKIRTKAPAARDARVAASRWISGCCAGWATNPNEGGAGSVFISSFGMLHWRTQPKSRAHRCGHRRLSLCCNKPFEFETRRSIWFGVRRCVLAFSVRSNVGYLHFRAASAASTRSSSSCNWQRRTDSPGTSAG